MNLPDSLLANQARLTSLRRDIHAHPELAFEEDRTADLVARALEAAGIEVHRGLARTGVVGVLRAGDSLRSIALRADMDALPIQEQNLFPHRSGHDGHTAMLLGAAECLADTRDFDGTAVFVFQPAEETVGGARVMIEEGLFRRFPVDAVFGMHNWPGLPAGQFAVHAGPVMACSDQFDITVRGHGSHAAMPHQGHDPLSAAADLVQALQGIVRRNLDPLDAAVLSVTRLWADGGAYNVIPERAELRGTVRAFRTEVQDLVEAAMERICNGVAASHGVQIGLQYQRGYPPTVNATEQAEVCRRVLTDLVGADQVRSDLRSMGAEDFAYMLRERPGCYVWIGNGPGEGGCMLHNPHYDFNDEILTLGAAYWVRLAEHLLPK